MNRGMVATPIKLLLYYGKTWYCSWLTQINSEIVSGQCFWGEFWDNGVKTITEGSLEVKLPTIWTDGKAEVGRVREEKRREEERRSEKRKSQKKEDAGARKGRKVAKHCAFPMICGSRGSKSRLAKAAGAEPTSRREMNNCILLWRETHFEVKMYKTHHVQSTFGSWDQKSARRCGATHIWKSTCTKHTIFGALLEVTMFKKYQKVHVIVARSTFRSQRVQNTSASEHFWKLRCWKSGLRCGAKHSFRVAGARDCALCQKWAKREGFHGFCNISKNDGRHGTFEEDLQIWISRGRCSTRDMFIRDVRRSGRWFPETGCILKHQIFRFAKMILRDRSSTLYGLASLFRGRRAALDRWSGKMEKSQIALVRGRLCIQLSILEGSLAEFFRFWRCQAQKLRRSRRNAEFLTLLNSKIEEVSQNCFVFDVVSLKNWGSLAE